MEEFDTIITGAGISMASPSNLPGGVALAKLLWRSLSQPCKKEIQIICATAEKLIFPEDKNAKFKGLRLEGLCGVLSRYMPFTEISKVYDAVGSTEYNFNHIALTRLFSNGHITLNLDTLLEIAGKKYMDTNSIIHLHGVWNEYDTIITTIGQYLGGLPRRAYHQLATALFNKRVLVIGYSGADIDIFPMFRQYPPRYIKWIKYKNETLMPEVSEWIANLSEHNPSSICVESTTAEEFLFGLMRSSGIMTDDMNTLYQESTKRFERKGTALPPSFLSNINYSDRLMGISAVLLEIGMCDEAVQVLLEIDGNCHVSLDRDKLMSRAYKRLGNYTSALQRLTRQNNGRFSAWKTLRNATEFASLLPHLRRMSNVAFFSDGFIIYTFGLLGFITKYKKGEYLARVRRAKLNFFPGKLNQAMQDFRFLSKHTDNDLMKLLSIGSFVDAVSWYADVLKMKGEYFEALAQLNKIRDYVTVYANVNQQAFVLFKLAEVSLLAGADEDIAFNALGEALDYVTLKGDGINPRRRTGLLPIWILSAYGDIYGNKYGADVQTALSEAETYVSPLGDRYGATIYYLLHLAERARTENNHQASIDLANKVLLLEKDQRYLPKGYLSEKAMAFNILGMCLCDESKLNKQTVSSDGIMYLQKARTLYSQMGMFSGVARIDISIAEAKGEAILDEKINEYERNGWILEAKRAKHLEDDSKLKAWVILA